MSPCYFFFFFFFNDTATTEIYTLSLHDALPISFLCPKPFDRSRSVTSRRAIPRWSPGSRRSTSAEKLDEQDRKSTRLNSSHLVISYAVFCLKKKKNKRLYASLRNELARQNAKTS